MFIKENLNHILLSGNFRLPLNLLTMSVMKLGGNQKLPPNKAATIFKADSFLFHCLFSPDRIGNDENEFDVSSKFSIFLKSLIYLTHWVKFSYYARIYIAIQIVIISVLNDLDRDRNFQLVQYIDHIHCKMSQINFSLFFSS